MALGVVAQLGQAGHGAIGVLDLADDPGGGEAGKPGQIDGGLGVAGTFEHAPLPRPQGEDVPRPAQIRRSRGRVEGHLDRAGPVFGRNAAADAMLGTGVDADGEGRLVVVGVLVDHQGQLQRIESLPLHGQADEAPGLGGHEVDLMGGGELGGTDQIAFVLPVLVVHNDDAGTIANGRQRPLDRIKRRRAGPLLPAHDPSGKHRL